ncbi:restriction endonuclease subunit S [Paenibacillus mendelii]|uniref:Restriction endonuclease subunit S n=1 Tax=Paenibacillus mendelii TaxID=206163 RepID=A0ABV6J8Z2_9BACL|nr:restriction endonuclease subunit S [Paenibacillus mendelii]MCQ6559694.1 restriction endonuclease subunit S [Paenibacillus mendelii]
MSRETSYARMLEASAKLQRNVAVILEAKASEAEKVRSWLCNHVTPDAYQEHQAHLKDTLGVHEQLIEVIDGLSKLNQGMANVLKAALRHDQEESSGFGNFDFGEKTE